MRKLLLILSLLLTVAVQGQTPMRWLVKKTAAPSTCADTDGQAFITAAGVTDATYKNAVCQLVQDLKSNSLWAGAIAIYPLCETTAGVQKWNLKDPQDLDASYRLTFSGSITHGAQGLEPAGGTGDTHVSYNVTSDDLSLAVYITENAAVDYSALGIASNISELYTPLASNGNVYLYRHGTNTVTVNGAYGGSDYRGFYLGNSTASGTEVYYNGVQKATQATAATQIVGSGATYKINPATNFTITVGFIWVGTALTSGEQATLNTIIEAYMDAVGRGYQ